MDKFEGLVLLGLGRAAMSAFVYQALRRACGRDKGRGSDGSLDAGGARELRVGRCEDGGGDGEGSEGNSEGGSRTRADGRASTAVLMAGRSGRGRGRGRAAGLGNARCRGSGTGPMGLRQEPQPNLGAIVAEASLGDYSSGRSSICKQRGWALGRRRR